CNVAADVMPLQSPVRRDAAVRPSITTSVAKPPARSPEFRGDVVATIESDVHTVEFEDSRRLLAALRAVRRGDFSVRLVADGIGVNGEIAEVFNDIVELNAQMTSELARLNRAVRREGRLSERVTLGEARGGWARSVDS